MLRLKEDLGIYDQLKINEIIWIHIAYNLANFPFSPNFEQV